MTNTKTIQAYVDVYGGPPFQIHFKYSTCLCVTYIAFMYGAGMPFLFPVAALTLFVLYTVERLLVAYSYKEPPSYDEKINKSAINKLLAAPLLYLAFGYWMYSNPQIFTNEIIPKKTISEIPLNEHAIIAWPKTLVSVPYFATFWLFLILVVFKKFYRKLTQIIYPAGIVNLQDIDENVDDYFDSLKDKARIFMIREEQRCREHL